MPRLVAALIVSACTASQSTPPVNNLSTAPQASVPSTIPMVLIDDPLPLGTEVSVDVFEPVYDSSQSTVPRPGELEIQIPTHKRFVIAPGTTPEERRAGALAVLPKLRAPMRVRGVLAADPELVAKEPGSLRLVAHSIEPLAFPKPTRRASTSELTRMDWYVEVEGTYSSGFEWSTLDGKIWVDFYPHYKHACVIGPAGRVRLTGFYHGGFGAGGYGHMGAYDAEIIATEVVEFQPDCAK